MSTHADGPSERAATQRRASTHSLNDEVIVAPELAAIIAAASHSSGTHPASALVPQQSRSWKDALKKASSLRTPDDLLMLQQFCRQHESVKYTARMYAHTILAIETRKHSVN